VLLTDGNTLGFKDGDVTFNVNIELGLNVSKQEGLIEGSTLGLKVGEV